MSFIADNQERIDALPEYLRSRLMERIAKAGEYQTVIIQVRVLPSNFLELYEHMAFMGQDTESGAMKQALRFMLREQKGKRV